MGRRAWLVAAALCLAAWPVRAGEDRAALMQAHRGGTLRLLASAAAGTLDPQVNRTAQFWQVFGLAYDGLVAFRKVAGPPGRAVVADLAEAVPEPEDGGRTWVFRLRPGVRFSDGRPVRPADVAASLRRAFVVPGASGGAFYGAIFGAESVSPRPHRAGSTVSALTTRRARSRSAWSGPTRSSWSSSPCRAPASCRPTCPCRTPALPPCPAPAPTGSPRMTRQRRCVSSATLTSGSGAPMRSRTAFRTKSSTASAWRTRRR